MYGTISYTTKTGTDYSFTYDTKQAFIQAMHQVQANRDKLTRAAFTPIQQPARARTAAFGKPISREEWLAMKGQK